MPRWLDLLDRTTRTCVALDRPDLARWLRHRRARLLDPQLRVLVVGGAKQGKSQLVNALLNATVCPAGDRAGRRVATVVQHGAAPSAHLVRRRPARPHDDEPAEDRLPLPVERLADLDAGDDREPHRGLLYAEVGLPRSLLAGGLALIEAPAVDWSDPVPEVTGIAAVTRADTVLFVTEATRELSRGELALLAHLGRSYPGMVVALTKTDLAPDWRRVLRRNRQRLAEAGVPVRLLALSATLRLHAARTGDQALNTESGFPHLVTHLRQTVAGKSELLAPAAVGLATRTVLEDLAAALREELSVQRKGGTSDAMSRLHEAQRGLEELRRRATRWQYALADEVSDLVSDIEYDLRERTRAVLRRADERLDEADPARTWQSFAEWLDGSLRDAAEANFGWLAERIDAMAARVAREFPPGTADRLPQWTPALLRDAPDRVDPLDRPTVDRLSLSQKVFTGLRGSYGGVLMFGLATGLAGMPLINPISLGAGALFAGKSIRDESLSTRKRRQATAKAAVQRHVDDVFARLNKDAKDVIRQAQRVLRGHFTELTEELRQAVVESARTAKQAVDDDAAVRDHRARRIQRELVGLAGLYKQATALGAGRAVLVPAQRRPPA
ncbi:GTP-binding protein [Dactylosporangium roseum]|uniref:GTP-binding protein n=1 Tax=Dactylosporangium roseum TaxID=47989 RepID=A0ABY5ZDV7_9ACTN|nr:GTP-binding protein [Dactylosporangium roseum]